VPLAALLSLPNVKVSRQIKLPSDEDLASTDGYLFMLPRLYTPVSHCVAIRKFMGHHYLLDSSLPLRDQGLPQPGRLNTRPCDTNDDPWRPQWGKEPLDKKKMEKLLADVLMGDQPSKSVEKSEQASKSTPTCRYDSPLLFAVSCVPNSADLEKLDTMALYKAFDESRYEQVARLCTFSLRPRP